MDLPTEGFAYDVVVVGGAGHVGLPLAVAFASRGLKVCIYDINEKSVATILGGELPFREDGAQVVLRQVLDDDSLTATTDDRVIGDAEHVVVVIGTPVDEHLNPDPHAVPKALRAGRHHLRTGQLVVLRSTVYPGVTKRVEKMLSDEMVHVDVAFCPERIA